MTLPANVVRTREMEWRVPALPLPFGMRFKNFSKRLPLVELGFHMEEIPPGMRVYPLHAHLFEEEQFYLLSGTLTVTERLPDGTRREFPLHAGELIAYRGGTGIAHALHNRGAEPAVMFAMSEQHPGDICVYPDSGKTNFRKRDVGAWLARSGHVHGAGPQAADEANAIVRAANERIGTEKVIALSAAERPAHVAVPGLPEASLDHRFLAATGVELSVAAGGRALSVTHCRIAPGSTPAPLQRHRYDERALLMLSGRLTLRQREGEGDVESTCELEAGDVTHWAANSIAHQLRNDGSQDATFVLLSTARPWNVIEFPELGELYSHALDQRGHLERLDYFTGERTTAPEA